MTEKEVTILSVKFDRMNEDIKEIKEMIKEIHARHATKEELEIVDKRVSKIENDGSDVWKKIARWLLWLCGCLVAFIYLNKIYG